MECGSLPCLQDQITKIRSRIGAYKLSTGYAYIRVLVLLLPACFSCSLPYLSGLERYIELGQRYRSMSLNSPELT